MSAERQIYPGLKTIRIIIKVSSLVFGLTLAFIAIWAVQLGIDNNPSFGPRRFGMLFLGIGFMLWAVWDWIGPKLTGVFANGWLAFNIFSFIFVNMPDHNLCQTFFSIFFSPFLAIFS